MPTTLSAPPHGSRAAASAPDPPRARPATSKGRALAEWALFAALLGALIVAGRHGVALRAWLWEATAPTRFTWDIHNGFTWGQRLVEFARERSGAAGEPTWGQFLRGYIGFYDHVVASAPDGRFGLDYSPLRLLVMSAWVKHTRDVHGAVPGYDDAYAWPLLRLNLACEVLAAAGVMTAVGWWVRRTGRSRAAAATLATIAGLICWYNPSTLIDAQAWPQWDVWIAPAWAWAMALASQRRFTAAGACVGVGALLKGQILMVAPVLVVWPLLRGRWGEAGRCAAGMAAGFLGGSAPLMTGSWTAAAMALAAVALLAVPLARGRAWRLRWTWWTWASAAALTVAMIPLHRGDDALAAIALASAAAVLLLGRAADRSLRAGLMAAGVAGVLVLTTLAFDRTWSWYQVGYAFPQEHHRALAMGPASNLPALLMRVYRLELHTPAAAIPVPWRDAAIELDLRDLLVCVYAATLALCAWGAARHDRRGSPGLLVALVAPWALMFALMPQMHERYLFWAAALGGVAIASSLGMTLMHLLIVLLSSVMIGHQLLNMNPRFLPEAHGIIGKTYPSIGWAVVLAALIYLYAALRVPSRLPAPREPDAVTG